MIYVNAVLVLITAALLAAAIGMFIRKARRRKVRQQIDDEIEYIEARRPRRHVPPTTSDYHEALPAYVHYDTSDHSSSYDCGSSDSSSDGGCGGGD